MQNNHDLQRIEAFSDGVFAIAATLLILEIKVPKLDDINAPNALINALKMSWPSFLAFTISFGSILVMWVNHHDTVRNMDHASKPFLFGNGFLLFTITFVPFPTAVLAEYINTPQAGTAVLFYSSSYLLCNIGFCIWWYTVRKPEYCLKESISDERVKKLTTQVFGGFSVYLFTTIIAYWFPVFSLIIIFALFALWVSMSITSKQE